MRRFTCCDCRKTQPASDSGPLPIRCAACKTRAKRRRRSDLAVVAPSSEVVEPTAPVPAPPTPHAPLRPADEVEPDPLVPQLVAPASEPAWTTARPQSPPPGVHGAAQRLLAEMFTDHPAADVLTELALRLAREVDHAEESRDVVAASKELRALLHDLTQESREAEHDDPFGIAGVPS